MGRQAYFLVHHERQLYLDETSQRLNLVPQKDGEYQTFLQGLDKPCLLGFISVLHGKIIFSPHQKCSQTRSLFTKPRC